MYVDLLLTVTRFAMLADARVGVSVRNPANEASRCVKVSLPSIRKSKVPCNVDTRICESVLRGGQVENEYK